MPSEEDTLFWRQRALPPLAASYEELRAEVEKLGIVEVVRRHGTDRWKHARRLEKMTEENEKSDREK